MTTVAELISLPYDTLFLNDVISNGEIAKFLSEIGYANLTVCPECGVDDFTHMASCSKQKDIEALQARLATQRAGDA